jgi:hypothetical protein
MESEEGGGMSEKDDGGPAFPFATEQTQRGWNGTREGEPGMSLRDYFACYAPITIGEVIAMTRLAGGTSQPSWELLFNTRAEMRYADADAMLKARKK